VPSKQDKAKIESKPKPPEESYHALIKLGSDMGQAVVMLRNVNGIEGKQVFISNMWAGITGYSRSELLGTSFFELVKEEDRQASIERYRKRMSGKPVPGKFYLSIRCKSGEDAHLELSSAVSASDGSATNIMFIRDVSSQVVSEAKAREFEEQFQTIIDLASDTGEAIVILQTLDGVEGRYVFVNDLWSDITGYSKEELLNMSAFDLIAPEHKQASRDRYRAVLSGKVQPKLFEGAIITKSGELVPVELSIAPINYHGIPSAIVHLRDITERKCAEEELKKEKERYQTLFENSPVAISEGDFSKAKQLFDYLNSQGVTDFNAYFEDNPDTVARCYQSNNKFITNSKLLELKESSDKNSIKFRHLLKNACLSKNKYWIGAKNTLVDLAEGRTRCIREGSTITADGKIKSIQFYMVVAPGHEQDLSKVFFYHIDLTDLKEKERKLQEYRDHLEELVSTRTEELTASQRKLQKELEQRALFTHALVHELNTPLTPMLGAGEILADNIKDEPYAGFARNLNQGILRLHQRVNELLDLARGEVGMLKLDIEEVNPAEVVNEAINYMKIDAEKYGHELMLEIGSESLPPIKADRKRLQEILFNLIANSIKYSPEPDKILIKVFPDTENIIFSVADNGIGMDDDTLKYAFQYYYREKENRKGGLGLGLSLCKLLVNLHGGEIALSSEKRVGTTVRFSIPVIKTSNNR